MDQELPPGTVVAQKYTVERVLGRGGMGVVYAVTHRTTGKRLALKCLLQQHASAPEVVERFEREARATGRVQHRHVVDVFDVGREGNLLFLVMEYLEGKPLAELIAEEPLPAGKFLRIMLRAMEGVAAAHDHGILHRDLKPANIFVCAGESDDLDDPRVLDFGVSKLEEEHCASLTLSGIAMGTPTYMPLEQLTGRRDLDARADIYALGVILYEALAGQLPHDGDNMASLAIRVATAEPLDLARLRPDLPPGLCAAVMRAIARERAQRQSSVRDLIEALRPFASEATAGCETRRQPKGEAEPKWPLAWASPSACTQPATPQGGPGEVQSDAVTFEREPASARAPRRSGRRAVWALFAALLGGGSLAWLLRGHPVATDEKRVPHAAASMLEARTRRAHAEAARMLGDTAEAAGPKIVKEREASPGPRVQAEVQPSEGARNERRERQLARSGGAERVRVRHEPKRAALDAESLQREPLRAVRRSDAHPSENPERSRTPRVADTALRTAPLSPDEF